MEIMIEYLDDWVDKPPIKLFEGVFFNENNQNDISKIIYCIIKEISKCRMHYACDLTPCGEVFIQCEDKYLRERIISHTVDDNSGITFRSEINLPKDNSGINVFIK